MPEYTSNQGIRKRRILNPLLFTLFIGFALYPFLFSGHEALSYREPEPPKETTTTDHRLKVTHSLTVRKNDTFYSILTALNVPSRDILRIVRNTKDVYDLRRLKKGDHLKITTIDGRLDTIEYRFSETEGVIIKREAGIDGFRAYRFSIPYEVKYRFAYGRVDSSLYQAGVSAGVDPEVMLSFFDIFAWVVDFATDIRKGDTFKILYETIYVEGKFLKNGRILAAEMVNNGKRFTAIYFEDSNNRGEYYNLEGRSLRRTLLSSPLRYRRISSHFTRRRFHPILKKYVPHHGVDYAAPKGTPVESAGDGRVIFAGWKRGYGYYVKIRHNSIYTTAYGHLSRIKRGIKKGRWVSQGEVIGYVGATGLATAPHLHYEVMVRGRLVNPLTVKPASKKYISRKDMPRFSALREGLIREFFDPLTPSSMDTSFLRLALSSKATAKR